LRKDVEIMVVDNLGEETANTNFIIIFKYQTLISCNKNAVYRGITQTLLLEAFSDLADGLLGL
jgi:hypothetical protein